MAKIQRPSKEALIRFFKGDCEVEEAGLVKLYLSLEIDAPYVQQCLKDAWDNLNQDPELAYDLVEHETAWEDFLALRSKPEQVRSKMTFWKYSIAAAAVIVCASICLFLYKTNHLLRATQANIASIHYKNFLAPKGQLTTVTLPDSTKVTMFPGANLAMPDNYNAMDRRVKLTGKAYFDVKHNSNRPFYVSSGELTTHVLGTSFQISPLRGNKGQSVVLHTGMIAVNYRSAHLGVLVPNQQMTLQENGKFTIKQVESVQLISWTKEQLRYDQVSLAEICRELEDWYGVQIMIDKDFDQNKKLTANFYRKPLNTVLAILAITGNFKYSIQANKVKIYEEEGGKHRP